MTDRAFRIAVAASAFGGDPRSVAMAARMAGFSGLQLELVTSGLDLPGLSRSGRRELLHALSAQSLELASLNMSLGPMGLASGDVDRAVSRVSNAMETAAGLGGVPLCIDVGGLPAAPAMPTPRPAITAEQAGLIIVPPRPAAPVMPTASSPAPDPNQASQVDGAMKELGAAADRFGVTVALRSELSSLASLEQALRGAGCPWFGVDLDPVVVLRDEWPLGEAMSRLGVLIRHVRGRDATRGLDRRTAPAAIGGGSTDWRELLNALDAAGYQGWLTIDPVDLPDRRAGAMAGLRHLRGLA
jgi:sugar phosphate isomerase/epimerase